MITSLKIQNYKNLSGLEIDSLSRVNLFSGKNNVGKSSLLEALALLVDDTYTSKLFEILQIRGERFSNDEGNAFQKNIDVLSSLFTGHNFSLQPTNVITIKSNDTVLRIKFVYYIDQKEEDGSMRRMVLDEEDFDKLKSEEFKIGLEISRNSHDGAMLIPIYRSLRYYRRTMFPLLNTPANVIYIDSNPKGGASSNAKYWDKITLTEKEQIVINALQIIEPDLENLAYLEDGYRDRYPIIKLKGDNARYPLQSMGDGINHILSIVLALVNCENGYVLIDEFDNGLHYSVQTKLWDVIFELSRRLNIQVFATTHSFDCIRGFKNALAQSKDNDGQYMRLEYKNNKIQVVDYTLEELNIISSQNIEVR